MVEGVLVPPEVRMLESFWSEKLEDLNAAEVEMEWAGILGFSDDGLPYMGPHRTRNQGSRIAELIVRRAPCDRGSPQGPQDERRAGNPPPGVLSAKLTPKNA